MNAAEQLRNQLVNGNLFDRKKVLETVTNGIVNNGGLSEIIIPYNPPCKIRYGSYDIECSSSEELEGIKEFLKKEGFRIRTAYHPISGRAYGYEARL